MTRTTLERRIDELLAKERLESSDVVQTLLQFARETINGTRAILLEDEAALGVTSGMAASGGQIIDWSEPSGSWIAYAAVQERSRWPNITPYDQKRLEGWAQNSLRYGGGTVRLVLQNARDHLRRMEA